MWFKKLAVCAGMLLVSGVGMSVAVKYRYFGVANFFGGVGLAAYLWLLAFTTSHYSKRMKAEAGDVVNRGSTVGEGQSFHHHGEMYD